MVALTLVAVVVAVLHPIAWTDEELRFAVARAGALAARSSSSARSALGRLDAPIVLGPLAVTPLLVAIALGLGSPSCVAPVLARRAARVRAARRPARRRTIPAALLEPPAPPPDGWLRPGWLLGLPVAVGGGLPGRRCRSRVYVVSYIPWAMIERPPDRRGLAGRPHRADAARPDRPDVPLPQQPDRGRTRRRRRGGPGRSTSSRSGSTRRASPAARRRRVYDAGNLVIWWLGVPAMAFVALMAFKRRSLALALIAIGFAASGSRGRGSTGRRSSTTTTRRCRSWSWPSPTSWPSCGTARRAGPGCSPGSRRRWRSSARPLLWICRRPLCGFVGVAVGQPGLAGLPGAHPELRADRPDAAPWRSSSASG